MATNGIELLNNGIAYGKKIAKWLLMAGLVLLVLSLVIQGKKARSAKQTAATATESGSVYAPPTRAQEVNFPILKAETAKGFPRKYIKVVDLSNMTEKSPPQVIPYPKSGDEWVSVILPVDRFVVKKFPSTKVKYEYGAGYPVVVDGPDIEIQSKDVPPAFDMQGVEGGGVLTVRCYLKPDDWAKRKNVSSQTSSVKKKIVHSPKKVRAAHKKDLPASDIPPGQQIM